MHTHATQGRAKQLRFGRFSFQKNPPIRELRRSQPLAACYFLRTASCSKLSQFFVELQTSRSSRQSLNPEQADIITPQPRLYVHPAVRSTLIMFSNQLTDCRLRHTAGNDTRMVGVCVCVRVCVCVCVRRESWAGPWRFELFPDVDSPA